MSIKRGQIYFVNLDPVQRREQAGKRPVLVLSIDEINDLPLVVTVIMCLYQLSLPRPRRQKLLRSRPQPDHLYQMDAEDVKAKQIAAIEWCKNASDYNQNNGGKPWCYTLIPHDEIKENMTLKGLSSRFLSIDIAVA
jgi:mRNA-degrading endonuclease toxin of MazEF toxin-antitoxin module